MLTQTGRKGRGSALDSLQGLKQSQIKRTAGCNTLCSHEGEPHPSSWTDSSENKGICLDHGIAKAVISFPLVGKKRGTLTLTSSTSGSLSAESREREHSHDRD